jgi:MFS family permease
MRRSRWDDAGGGGRIAVTAAFAGHAVVVGTLGPWMPLLKDRASLDAGDLGIALTGLSAGLLLGTRVAGPMLRRVGVRFVIRLAVVLMAGILGGLPALRSLWTLASGFAVLGVISGVLDVGMNDAAVAVERLAQRRVMSAIHGTWSVAMLASAGVASIGVSVGLGIQSYFVAVAMLLGVTTFPFLRWLPPGDGSPGLLMKPSLEPRPGLRDHAVAALCSVGAAAFIVEGTANEWSAVYLRDHVRASHGVAAFGVVAFSAGMVASRFMGDRLATRFGAARVARSGAALGALALGAALLIGGAAVTIAAFAVVGIGVGPVVPLAISAAGAITTAPGRSALGVVVTSAYVGSVVGPAVLGYTADRAGLRAAFVLPVVAGVVIAVLAGAVGTGERTWNSKAANGD